MLPKIKDVVLNFLREIHAEDKESLEPFRVFLENIENKDDPDPIELQIVDTSYQLLEKLDTLENLLKNYNKQNLVGNKLNDLLDKTSATGSSILFD
jgi:3'-phosphoadenosine 5'-phosphosulfate sulfotransferase (PAPS reductase)/FAD synthetase